MIDKVQNNPGEPTPPQERPVFVFIQGHEINTPKYSDIVKIKQECEKYGQKFILIPEPDENGLPVDNEGKRLNMENFSIADIEKSLNKYFGKDGKYEGQKYTSYINTHGDFNVVNDKIVHTHTIKPDNNHNSPIFTATSQIYDSILNIGRCDNLYDGACFAGAGVQEINNSLLKLDKERDFHFASAARSFETSAQADVQGFLEELPKLARKNIPITNETINNAIGSSVRSSDVSSPTIEVVFNEKNRPSNDNQISYEDHHAKLELQYSDVKNGVAKRFEDKNVQKIFDEYKNTNATFNDFIRSVRAQGVYFTALNDADKYYDNKNENNNNAKTRSEITNIVADLLSDHRDAVNYITDPKQAKDFVRDYYKAPEHGGEVALASAKLSIIFKDEPETLAEMLKNSKTHIFSVLLYEDKMAYALKDNPSLANEIFYHANNPTIILEQAERNSAAVFRSAEQLGKVLSNKPEILEKVFLTAVENRPTEAILFLDSLANSLKDNDALLTKIAIKAVLTDTETAVSSMRTIGKALEDKPIILKEVLFKITETPAIFVMIEEPGLVKASFEKHPDILKAINDRMHDPNFIMQVIKKEPEAAYMSLSTIIETFKDQPEELKKMLQYIKDHVKDSGKNIEEELKDAKVKLKLTSLDDKHKNFDDILKQEIPRDHYASQLKNNLNLPKVNKPEIELS